MNFGSRSFAVFVVALVVPTLAKAQSPASANRPLTMLVMDPLAEPLSCACVPGLGQRKYDRLTAFLSKNLGREIKPIFEESLNLGRKRANGPIHFIIGKRSMMEFDAKLANLKVCRVAAMTNSDGKKTVQGAIVVHRDSGIQKPADLKGRKLMLGPEADAETNHAAIRTINKLKLDDIKIQTAGSIEAGVFAVTDGEADATVITDYLPPLLEGCGKIAKGELRIIGKTDPVPFIEVFATEHAEKAEIKQLQTGLIKANGHADLLKALESKTGFALLDEKSTSANDPPDVFWTDWRGPNRAGQSPFVPQSLPKTLKTLWTAKVTGPALAGITATADYVMTADKDADLTRDIFRCLDAQTGKELWTLEYPSLKKLEYTNAPRATPVIDGDQVYLLGAMGQLHCVELSSGKIVWQKDFTRDFAAECPHWGWSSPPLVVGDKLIINPGAKEASIVALDKKTGKTIWKTPGHASAYSAFVLGTFSGVRQIIGYDVAGLGGWDVKTGRRLWEMIPPRRTDFNVGTPVIIGQRILLSTENNETRLYEFDKAGRLKPKPVAVNHDLAPDTCSPVVIEGRIIGSAYGELVCLDLENNLKTVWAKLDDFFYDHTNIIAGHDRALIWTTAGDLLLIDPAGKTYKQLAHLRPLGNRDVESMSHPAIVDGRIYLRNSQELKCLTWK